MGLYSANHQQHLKTKKKKEKKRKEREIGKDIENENKIQEKKRAEKGKEGKITRKSSRK